ncbi:hydroxyethylthiazole kinase [Streptococcus caviae]|uniref:hydroxyethylthiazole kinase n=1 Tax=Streptococcus sp. 'caviae' TaxID=1915004 RepID=UPI00094BA60B|nr:hydroxyethylthiazole kinase [Streptococcus sp. 'caviae']OLN83837.1 hydroxyethylthiazole kinase [Streptococcus sp. 'caviae']
MITFNNPFPLKGQPLIHCLTNEISIESVANAILSIGAKPVMADDPREITYFLKQSQALLLNLGHLSREKEKAIRRASQLACSEEKPCLIDMVGIAASPVRHQLALDLLQNQPAVIKGNTAEMRHFCGLTAQGRGIDAHPLDYDLTDLTVHLKAMSQHYPDTVFLATGSKDLIVYQDRVLILKNGTPLLNAFTGTGDLVGALAACFLGAGEEKVAAAALAVSYINICGEKAQRTAQGLADFRFQTLNQLSLLHKDKSWLKEIKGDSL